MAMAASVPAAGLVPAQRGGSEVVADPAALRDALTAQRLVGAVAHLPHLQVVGLQHDWWDGSTHVTCLLVRGGRRGRRLRVVETDGAAVVLPWTRRLAARWLAGRRPRRCELVPRVAAASAGVTLTTEADAVRCGAGGCAAMRPLAQPACPACGALPSEEKSTGTGARTAGSSVSK